MAVESKRKSNLELLRMLSMYMIVFIHANMYLSSFCSGGWWHFFNGFVNGICNTGVTCFILISGYFGMKFKVSKLVKMELMMITYSLLELALIAVFMPQQLAGAALLEALVKACFPFITRKYWFYSCYICIYLFSGFIDAYIKILKKKEFEKLLLMMLVIFSVFPTVCYFEIMQDHGKGLVQMLMIYLIGRYIRLYKDDVKMGRKAVGLLLILWAANGLSANFPLQLGGIWHHLCKDNSITNIIIAVIIFCLFKNADIQSEMINKASSYLFAVFALNNTLVTILFEILLPGKIPSFGGIFGFLMLEAMVLAVMLGCLLAGAAREALLGRLDDDAGRRISGVIEVIRNRWEEK